MPRFFFLLFDARDEDSKTQTPPLTIERYLIFIDQQKSKNTSHVAASLYEGYEGGKPLFHKIMEINALRMLSSPLWSACKPAVLRH
jgi:hypothetical protein